MIARNGRESCYAQMETGQFTEDMGMMTRCGYSSRKSSVQASTSPSGSRRESRAFLWCGCPRPSAFMADKFGLIVILVANSHNDCLAFAARWLAYSPSDAWRNLPGNSVTYVKTIEARSAFFRKRTKPN
jgi:hypothetical protein